LSLAGFDPEILQDFLMESGELLEQLESNLVDLESTPKDPELLNEVFRALHTIKGSASFLALTNLVEIAHAAESALNAARNSVITIDRAAMDLLLGAVDILKHQFEELQAGTTELKAASSELVQGLVLLGEGKSQLPAEEGSDSVTASECAARDDGFNARPLVLSDAKTDLLDHFVDDLDETIARAQEQISGLLDECSREKYLAALVESAEELLPTTEFFEFDEMADLVKLLLAASEAGSSLSGEVVEAMVPRLSEIAELIAAQSNGIRDGIRLSRPIDDLATEIESFMSGQIPVIKEQSVAPVVETSDCSDILSSFKDESAEITNNSDSVASPTKTEMGKEPEKKRPAIHAPEQTIRVEVGRLETLMNLVGELVLQKNRITSIADEVGVTEHVNPDLSDSMGLASDTLARITSDIQVAVMRTRMQPLDKLFGKYPRLIRDLSTKTGKQMQLVIEGGDTEVDKSVIEELGDPLVHLMRNSADHGLETPEQRAETGKDLTGTITLCAAHQGNHVEISIRDDGRGLSRDALISKAIERGLTTPTEASQLSDEEVFRFIFHPGFSMAQEVSDLSGRGVGMDVVRTNIQKLKGSVSISSELGHGTTITISIPLTVAIMPAMMVGIADEIYAIPLGNILEIVRPDESQFNMLIESRVLRLRDSVLPALDAMEVFGIPKDCRIESPFAIVLQANGRIFTLMVSSVIGQQEIVIKPLDGLDESGPVSGATVRNDGGVSLIIDVSQLLQESAQMKKPPLMEAVARG
jgi:two-component system, chemotaxis family, sensor kinase CheA